MRVNLTVPDDCFSEPADRAWRTFLHAVQPLTFEELDSEARVNVERQLGMPPGATANAEWVPPGRIMPEYAKFCFSEAFFRRDQDAQVVILLHEAAHIRLYRGRLTENYRLIRQQSRFPDVATEFELDRLNLSWEFLTFVQEVGVDKFTAAAECPRAISDRYFAERMWFYTNGEGHRYEDNRSPTLAVYRAFYRCLRTDLGLAVVQDQGMRGRQQALRDERDRELQRQAGEELPWFRDVQRKLLTVRVDTDEPDPDSYRELFDRVRNLAAPNQS